MRWSSRNGCAAGSSSVRTVSSPSALTAVARPVIGPPARRRWRGRGRARRSRDAPRRARRALRRRRPRAPRPGAVSSRRTTGMPCSGGSMSMPAGSIIFGIEPRLAMPMPAHAVQSIAMPRVAAGPRRLEIALHSRSLAAAVVGLAGVAEAAGDRARTTTAARGRASPSALHDVEPAVGLDVEDEVELALRLVRQEVADLQPAGVDAATSIAAVGGERRLDGGGDLGAVGEVDLVPARRAAGAPRSPRSRRAPRGRARCAPAPARRAPASARSPCSPGAGRPGRA